MPKPRSKEHGSRPYRSHKSPACDSCRRRKIRCNVDLFGQACLFCRERGLHCFQPARELTNEIDGLDNRKGPLLTKTSSVRPSSGSPANPAGVLDQKNALSGPGSIMLGPVVTEDVDILSRHIPTSWEPSAANTSYQSVSQNHADPVIYVTVPARPQRKITSYEAGRSQLEIMEQVLGPLKEEVRRLYFRFVHPHFPVLKYVAPSDDKQHEPSSFSSIELCMVYAISLGFWQKSEKLRLHPCPSSEFAWSQAVDALHEDYKAPLGVMTVTASAIDLIGRPSLSVVGNITNSARTVALAQSLGLHRDPSNWDISHLEKKKRVRVWWCVLIADHWLSIAYGVPSKIAPFSWDVPFPRRDELCNKQNTSEQISLAFIELCRVTSILADAMPLLYQLKPSLTLLKAECNQIEHRINQWEHENMVEQAVHLRHGIGEIETSNLQFCFLSVKLIHRRLACKLSFNNTVTSNIQTNCNLAGLREATSDLMRFTSGMEQTQLGEFWLPFTSHLLVSATMIQLRCTLEASDHETRDTCIAIVLRLQDRLRKYRDEHKWELGELCLEKCSDYISMVASKTWHMSTSISADSGAAPDRPELSDSLFGDDFLSNTPGSLNFLESLNWPWDTWDLGS